MTGQGQVSSEGWVTCEHGRHRRNLCIKCDQEGRVPSPPYPPLRCPACGSTLAPTLEYAGGSYSEHRDHTGYECDECPAAWDKNGDPTPPERDAYEGLATDECSNCGDGVFEPYRTDVYPWLHVGGWRYCPRLPDEDKPSRVATPARGLS